MNTSAGDGSQERPSGIPIGKFNKSPRDEIPKTGIIRSGLYLLRTTFHLIVVWLLHVDYPWRYNLPVLVSYREDLLVVDGSGVLSMVVDSGGYESLSSFGGNIKVMYK